MSSRYVLAAVLTLNDSVSPRFTLIWVAKPWIAAVPDPLTSHWLEGFPGFVFSHATDVGTAHGSVAATARATTTGVSSAASSPATTSIALNRREADVLASTVAPVVVMRPPSRCWARAHELSALVVPRSSDGRRPVIRARGRRRPGGPVAILVISHP